MMLPPLVIESDSVNVINLISNTIGRNLEIDWLMYDIRAFIYKKNVFIVKHILRSYNLAAHKAVKMALDHFESCTLLHGHNAPLWS